MDTRTNPETQNSDRKEFLLNAHLLDFDEGSDADWLAWASSW